MPSLIYKQTVRVQQFAEIYRNLPREREAEPDQKLIPNSSDGPEVNANQLSDLQEVMSPDKCCNAWRSEDLISHDY